MTTSTGWCRQLIKRFKSKPVEKPEAMAQPFLLQPRPTIVVEIVVEGFGGDSLANTVKSELPNYILNVIRKKLPWINNNSNYLHELLISGVNQFHLEMIHEKEAFNDQFTSFLLLVRHEHLLTVYSMGNCFGIMVTSTNIQALNYIRYSKEVRINSYEC